jgi:hypothetical protein
MSGVAKALESGPVTKSWQPVAPDGTVRFETCAE